MPTTVSGLTIPEAAEVRLTSLSISKVELGSETAYSPHDPDPAWTKLTLLPIQSLRF